MARIPLPALTLVCFAVREEAQAFRHQAGSVPNVQTLITGMGRRNAETSVGTAFASQTPGLLLTCGFAGGLRPGLSRGSLLFSVDPESHLETALLAAGGRPARFYCAERVASTAAEKQSLWQATGADAVEMESGFIRAICRRHGIPSATLRVILDPAEEDLPLDFSRVMTDELRLDAGKLMLAIARSPSKVAGLLRLQKQSRAAAATLGDALAYLLL